MRSSDGVSESGNLRIFAALWAWVGACLLALISVRAVAAPPLAATQLVDGYDKALSPFSRVTYVAEARAVSTINGKPRSAKKMGVREDEQGRAIWRMFYRRDGNRLDILSLKDGVKPGPEVWRRPEQHLHRVVVDNSAAILDYDNSFDDVRHAVVSKRTPKSFTAADSVRMEAGSLCGGETLDGMIMGRPDKSLLQILSDAPDLRVESKPQVIDGHACYLLECTDAGKGYSYQIWIDPSAGFNARRIIQKRLDPHGDGADVRVDDIEIKQIGIRFIAVAAHLSHTYRSGPNYLYISDVQYRRSDINFNPEFKKIQAFKLLVPPEIGDVRNEDYPEIEWIVKDGRFVPKMEVTLMDPIDHAMNEARQSASPHRAPAKSSTSEPIIMKRAASISPRAWPRLLALGLGLVCVYGVGLALRWWWFARRGT